MDKLIKLIGSTKMIAIVIGGVILTLVVLLKSHDKRVREQALYKIKKKTLDQMESNFETTLEKMKGTDESLEAKIWKNVRAREVLDNQMLETLEEGTVRREEIENMSAGDTADRINAILNS